MKQLWIIPFILIVLLAACSGSDSNLPTATPEGVIAQFDSPSDAERVVATPRNVEAFEQWLSANQVITPENVFQMTLIGRADSPEPVSTIFSYAFSSDGTRLAALNNNYVLVWDLITGRLLVNNARREAIQVFFSPDKMSVFTINPQGLIRIYGLERGREQLNYDAHPNYSQRAAYNVEQGLLALGGTDGTIKVWDVFNRVSLVTIDAHDGAVVNLRFTPDMTYLVSAGEDGEVIVWDWQNRERISTILPVERVIHTAISPKNDQIAIATRDVVTVWTLPEGEFLYTLQVGEGGASSVLLFSPDGRYLINGGVAMDMNVWTAASGDLVALLPGVIGTDVSAAFAPNSNLLLTAVLDGDVSLWNLDQIANQSLPRAALAPGGERTLDVAWSPDGFLMLFIDASGPVYVWGVE
ncbi:MAG: hypothetical protein CUN56_03165 [Phototrophicales bacterium]|nr:MAG: hypothetical protein CUN56_03165 [Phototrophicales bacterium]